jgi:hypothetical protein
MMLADEIIFFERAISFIHEIGIETTYAAIDNEDCFLPGLLITKGRIIIDENKMKFPGDILHEAAHIAIVPSAERKDLDGKNIGIRTDAAAEEMMAIAWTYAACIHLEIDPHFVFHEHGYKGGGGAIVENFENGNYIGVAVLQWLGITSTSTGKDDGITYPGMKKWMRD